jgi:hypothetical protein
MTSPSYGWVKDHYTQTLADIQLQDTITLNKEGDFWFTPRCAGIIPAAWGRRNPTTSGG